jgi:hypothetical protein
MGKVAINGRMMTNARLKPSMYTRLRLFHPGFEMNNRSHIHLIARPLLLLVLSVSFALSGCGQKGNLYLPDRSDTNQSR